MASEAPAPAAEGFGKFMNQISSVSSVGSTSQRLYSGKKGNVVLKCDESTCFSPLWRRHESANDARVAGLGLFAPTDGVQLSPGGILGCMHGKGKNGQDPCVIAARFFP